MPIDILLAYWHINNEFDYGKLFILSKKPIAKRFDD